MSGRNAGHESADVAQSVERRLGKAEVTGSIPVSSFIFFCKNESWHIFLADMGIGADFFYIFTVARC